MSLGAAVLGAGFLSTAGSLYANAVNSATQYKINQENASLQYAINADQIEAARMNNQTAIELANTAHQREIQDLYDAGLNPILSATGGNGAAVPSLDTPGLNAPSLSAPTITNPLSGVASAVQEAIQVSDQHDINKAKLSALGFTGDKRRDALNSLQIAEQAQAARNTALDQAHAESAEARLRELNADIDRMVTEDSLGGVSSRRYPGDVGWFNFRPTDRSIKRSEAYKLRLEALLSQLKLKANANWQQNVKSAKDITDSLLDVGGLFVPTKKKK